MHVVVGDKALRAACGRLPSVQVHEDLRDLFRLPGVAPHHLASEMRVFWKQNAALLETEIARDVGNALPGRDIESDAFPSDNGEATIDSFGDVSNVAVDPDTLDPISDTAFTATIQCEVSESIANLFIFKADYPGLDDERYSVADWDWNDHYLQAQAYVDLRVDAEVQVEVKRMPDGRLDFSSLDVDLVSLTVTSPSTGD